MPRKYGEEQYAMPRSSLERSVLRQSCRWGYPWFSFAWGMRPSSLRSRPAFTGCPLCFSHRVVSYCTRLRSRSTSFRRAST